MKKQRQKLVTNPSTTTDCLLYGLYNVYIYICMYIYMYNVYIYMYIYIYIHITFCKKGNYHPQKLGTPGPKTSSPTETGWLGVFGHSTYTEIKHHISGGVRLDVCSSGTPTRPDVWKVVVITRRDDIPSRQLTYPTFGKGNSSSKLPWKGIC